MLLVVAFDEQNDLAPFKLHTDVLESDDAQQKLVVSTPFD